MKKFQVSTHLKQHVNIQEFPPIEVDEKGLFLKCAILEKKVGDKFMKLSKIGFFYGMFYS